MIRHVHRLRAQATHAVTFACVSLMLASPARAAGSSMPWEAPLQSILESIEGPVAKIIAVIIIIVTGLTLAFGDSSGGFLYRGTPTPMSASRRSRPSTLPILSRYLRSGRAKSGTPILMHRHCSMARPKARPRSVCRSMWAMSARGGRGISDQLLTRIIHRGEGV